MDKTGMANVNKFTNELKQCIECGNCTFWCPIYQQRPKEEYVARGKNITIRKLLTGKIGYTEEVQKMMGMCTLCSTCAQHCPVKSKFQSVIIAARADKEKAKGLGVLMGIIYKQLIPRRKLFGATVRLASYLQKLIMRKSEGKMRHLPLFLSGMFKGRQIPMIANKYLRDLVPEVNPAVPGKKTRFRVAYFMGCSTDFVYPEIGKKLIEVLTKNGVEVTVPKKQGCCGAPIWLGAGDFDTGRRMADVNVEVFEKADYIITSCATCSSALKEYAKYLADNGERERKYTDFAKKIFDISEFAVDILKVNETKMRSNPQYAGKTVTWHDPCHLRRYQNIHIQPRALLSKMDGVEFREMRDAERCCGMAGSFSIYHYDVSKEIADKKALTIKETGADVIATGCPGCMIQISDALSRNNLRMEVKHIVELMD